MLCFYKRHEKARLRQDPILRNIVYGNHMIRGPKIAMDRGGITMGRLDAKSLHNPMITYSAHAYMPHRAPLRNQPL